MPEEGTRGAKLFYELNKRIQDFEGFFVLIGRYVSLRKLLISLRKEFCIDKQICILVRSCL
jgi:hypothetical protein